MSKYGLAKTATYIRIASNRASVFGKRNGCSGKQTFNCIYGNICFWVDNEKAREYTTYPINRGDNGLSESEKGMIFYHSFLSIHSVDFFSDPINTKSINKLTSAESLNVVEESS